MSEAGEVSRMRVLVLQDRLRVGGTEHQSILLTAGLAAHGVEASLVTFRPGGELAGVAREAGIDWTVLQSTDTGLDLFAPGLGRTIRERAPDAVICMGRAANCYAGWLQARHPEAAMIGTVRTGKPLPWLNRWSMRQARGVVVNTDWWRDRLARDGVDPERIHVVHNATRVDPDATITAAERGGVRRSLGAGPDTVVMCNVASFRPGKHQARLIEACGRLDPAHDWALWLVGGGEARAGCERLARASPVRDRIYFLGYRDDPTPLYLAADVAVSASLEDALPNFLVEAQTLGLPAIAVDYRGVREAVAHQESGLVVPGEDRAALADAMSHVIGDRVMRERFSAAAVARARRLFSPDGQMDALVRALAAIVASPESVRRSWNG